MIELKGIRALSIRQPWAWLIASGHKDIENRDWPSNFRGKFLIHASKTMTRADYDACRLFVAGFQEPFHYRIPDFDVLLRGGIVGEAEMVGCVTDSPSRWFCGRFGFQIKNAKPVPFTACKGKLGFFYPFES